MHGEHTSNKAIYICKLPTKNSSSNGLIPFLVHQYCY